MRSNKPAILATVCVAVLAINLNTTVAQRLHRQTSLFTR